LGYTPFKVLYGHDPNQLGFDVVESCQHGDLNNWLQERELMLQLVRQHLHRALLKIQQYVDNKRSFCQFAVGDSVYLKLQPYIQTSLATRSSNKLSFRYFGPFKITDKIGSVAYRLALPDSSSIHPVFHVSQLKKVIAASHQVSTELPDPSIQLQVPLRVLDRRLHRQLDQVIPDSVDQPSTPPVYLGR
jgi:hypothetical protein